MHGNAWEWVQDRCSDSYYAQSPSSDREGPSSGGQRVVRGGSWHSTSDRWSSSFRKPYPPDYRGISIGFRVERTTVVSIGRVGPSARARPCSSGAALLPQVVDERA